jgi:hypothetical protein
MRELAGSCRSAHNNIIIIIITKLWFDLSLRTWASELLGLR